MHTILITGAGGLLGKALKSLRYNDKYRLIFHESRFGGDLTDESVVKSLYEKNEPNIVIHCAAKVGGVQANINDPRNFFYQNIMMNTLMTHYADLYSVDRFFAFSSVCVFGDSETPHVETEQHKYIPHHTNYAYSYAKRMIDIQMQAYRSSSKTRYTCLIPTNLYGPFDNFNIETGHVVPALIHKSYQSLSGKPFVVFGDGSARRELLLSSDLARIVENMIVQDINVDSLIISNGQDISIREIMDIISERMGIKEVVYDLSKTVGQQTRKSCTDKFRSIFHNFKFTDYKQGIAQTIEWFMKNYPNVRK